MIRPALMKEVLEALESHPYLNREDFKVGEFKNQNGEPLISIDYRYDSDRFFRFIIPKRKEGSVKYYAFTCTLKPGYESDEEILSAEQRAGLVIEIRQWLIRMYEDMIAVPIVRQLEAISSTVEELRKRVQVLPDELLSRSEIDDFRQSLDLIKAEFSEQLKKEINDNEELKQKVNVLSKDIDFLKQTLESMTKRKWGEAFVTRLHKWKEKLSLRQITNGTRAITKLLPPDVAATVDGVADTVDAIAGAFEKTPDKANNQISKE